MSENNIKKRVLSSLCWRFAERCGAQIVQFVVSIVLARLLLPKDYGLVSLIIVFIDIASVFAQSGLGIALVQRSNADEVDFSSVFYFSIVFSLVIYMILFFGAKPIAGFYKIQDLVPVTRVLGLSVIIGAINSVQQAYVQKTMQFKRFFWSTLGGTLCSAFIGIAMAYKGFGVWALVCQQLTNQVTDTVILWITVGWRPKKLFSIDRMKRLFSFGWKMLVSALLDTIYSNLYSLVIGKTYSSSELAYYNKGKQFPVLIITNINSSIDNVLFPVLAEMQNEKERIKDMVRKSIKLSSFLIFPAMAGLAVIAEPLVIMLLTEKWHPAIVFVQFNCFVYAFWPIHTANLQVIKALGRSDIFLRLEIVKKCVGIIMLIMTLPFGLNIMMIGYCVTTLLSAAINAYPNRKLINYTYTEQVKDILPALFLSLGMYVVVNSCSYFSLTNMQQIILRIMLGVVVYFLGAKLCRLSSFEYILAFIKDIKRSK